MTRSHLLTQILRLQPRDRKALICDAIDSLPEEYTIDPDLTADQSAELDRRLDDYLKDPSKGRSWEQVDAGEDEDQGNKHKAYLPDFHPEAEEEHLLAVAEYELAQKGLGLRFHEEVQHLIARILENPFLYPAASLRRRKAVLDRFPYCIYYAVWKRKRIVTILSIHHAKRKRSRWQRRKLKWRP